jgi:hypothetical protein
LGEKFFHPREALQRNFFEFHLKVRELKQAGRDLLKIIPVEAKVIVVDNWAQK